ncbi:MAG: GIY-YIG nuclease family protein [Clostridium sp.]|jgi:putative endonuclease
MNENYTYILRCTDGTYYCGWTNNLDRRLKAHNEGKGAKYTRSRRPVALVYYEAFSTKEEAMRREYEIKQLPRKKKEELIFKQQTDTSSCNGRDFRP